MNITAGFNVFCEKVEVSEEKKSLIRLRYNTIYKKLNSDFWGIETVYGGIYIDCYGRGTAIDGVKKINMLFEMPSHLQPRYESKEQLQLLGDLYNSISAIYSKTTINRKQNCIDIAFSDKTVFSIKAVFIKDEKEYFLPKGNHSNRKWIDNPIEEIKVFKQANKNSDQVLSKLCQMTKSWKEHAMVKIEDVLIDTLAYRFLRDSKETYNSYSDFPDLCKDFFGYLKDQEVLKKNWKSIGGKNIHNPGNFRYKAILAHHKATAAIQQEKEGRNWLATQKWREVFGYRFPDRIAVESEIKGLFDASANLYSAQKLCAKIIKNRISAFRTFQVLLSLFIFSGVLVIEYSQYVSFGVYIFGISSAVFIANLYFKKYNLSDVCFKHVKSASKILKIQQEINLLIKELKEGEVEINRIREKKEEIQRNMMLLYKGTARFVNMKYLNTTQKLKMSVAFKEKKASDASSKIKIPKWQSNSFFIENQVQCLMNTRRLMNQ